MQKEDTVLTTAMEQVTSNELCPNLVIYFKTTY